MKDNKVFEKEIEELISLIKKWEMKTYGKALILFNNEELKSELESFLTKFDETSREYEAENRDREPTYDKDDLD